MGSVGRYIFRTTFGAFLVVLVSVTMLMWLTQAMRNVDLLTLRVMKLLTRDVVGDAIACPGRSDDVKVMIQGVGLITAISSHEIHLAYFGFFLYGTGLAGSFVLREVIWANFFGRASLGTVRGLSMFFSHLFAAGGAP